MDTIRRITALSLCCVATSLCTELTAFAQSRPAGLPPYITVSPDIARNKPPSGGWNPMTEPIPVHPGEDFYIAIDNEETWDPNMYKEWEVEITLTANQWSGRINLIDRAGYRTSDDSQPVRPARADTGKWTANQFKWTYQFDECVVWERIQFRNNSDETIHVTAWMSSMCFAGRSAIGNTFTQDDARIGVEDKMQGPLSVPELYFFPEGAAVDPGAQAMFIAPPHTGNWTAEVVYIDPDGNPKPDGGMRFVSDGPGLSAGEPYTAQFHMFDPAPITYEFWYIDSATNTSHTSELLVRQLRQAPLNESFEDAAPGGVMGQRGWFGWDFRRGRDAPVTNAIARTGAHSLQIDGGADIVREFAEVENDGVWSFSAWQYIPSDYISGGNGQFRGSHFLLLNTYQDGGPYHWSVDLQADSNTGMLKVYHGDGENTIDIPYETDRWTKVQIVIDLEDDWTRIYYDESLVTEYPWTGGILGDGGGAREVAVIDLWANGSSPVFYDDLKVERLEPTPADLFDVEILSGVILEGDVESLRFPDDVELHTRSGFGSSLSDLHRMDLRVSAVTGAPSPAVLDVTVEARIGEPSGLARLLVRDQTTGDYDIVDTYPVGLGAEQHATADLDASRYVSDLGEIDIRIKHNVFVPFIAFTFESWLDWVEIAVR